MRIIQIIKKIFSKFYDVCLSVKNEREKRVTTNLDVYQVEKGVFYKLVKPVSTHFSIPNVRDIKKIGANAFSDFSRSKIDIPISITIPRLVKKIDEKSFNNCSHLEAIDTEANHTVFGSNDGVLFTQTRRALMRFPEGKNVKIYEKDMFPSVLETIRPYAFFHCQHLRSISLPDTVKTICDFAFSGCSNLETVVLPDGLKTLDNYAFSDCASLQSVNRPTQLQDGIGADVFSGCVNLSNESKKEWQDVLIESPSAESVVIQKGTTEILDRFYKGWLSLNSVYIPKTVTSIGKGAFHACSKLKTIRTSYSCCCCSFWESVIFPLVLHGCSFLKVAVIPDSVTSIGEGAFRFCSSLESIAIPKGVTKIEDYTFSDCSGLVEVSFRGDIKSIGNCSFAHCRDLKLIELPTSVTSIGNGAFGGCESLESIKIPAGVTSIGDWAFFDCSSLTEIEVDSKNPKYCSYDGALFTKDPTTKAPATLVVCPEGKQRFTIPSGMTSIGDWAFSGCSSLTEIEVDSKNPKYCSYDGALFTKDPTTKAPATLVVCPEGKQRFTIPSGVTSIGDGAFDCDLRYLINPIEGSGPCGSLSSLVIPDSVKSIGRNEFFYGHNLVFQVHKGSYAEEYAKENGIKYETIE